VSATPDCGTPNPFVTGSAAVAAAQACAAGNPFLTGTAIDQGATAAVPYAEAQPASGSTTAPFGLPHDQAIAAGPRQLERADRVLVEKSQRRLYLLRSDRVIAEYPIRLGLNPYGPKQRVGDFRTPEGSYRLVRRNAASDFFLSVEVSYPNPADMARAREQGFDPGGLIMIHGQPNVPRKPAAYYASSDWTDGCIAVSNAAMVDIWLRTDLGTPVEIRP
jgi:hypothetical protein